MKRINTETAPRHYEIEVAHEEVFDIWVYPAKNNKVMSQETVRNECEFCGDADCEYNCDQSQSKHDDRRIAYNNMIKGIEAVLIYMAAGGYDLSEARFQLAVQHAVAQCNRKAYEE